MRTTPSCVCAAPAKGHSALPPRPVFTFICAACETVAIRPEQVLPEGWQVETVGETESCYCADCAIDLPKGQVQ